MIRAMRSSESGLGCSIRTSNCLASSPKRMGVSFTGFAMFHLAFVQGYNVPFRKHVYLTKNLPLKSNGLETTSPRLSLRFFPRARTEAGEWRRKPHVKVPIPRTAARRMCAADVPTAFPRSAADWRTGRGADSIRLSPRAADARSAGGAADVPTDFLRSAADWRQGVHSERGKESTRSAARARRGQRKLPQTERGVFAQARLATNCCARFPASGGASRLPRGLCPCRTNAAGGGV